MVSILLATRNGQKYLEKSIDSIINQKYQDFELLIGLNDTTDESMKIINSYDDLRIKVFNYEEKGKAITLNKLLKESSFDWIALQDDDDIWKENKLDEQIKLSGSFDVIGTFIDYINENDHIIGCPNLSETHEDIKARSLRGDNQVANTSAIFKKSDALSINGWREDLDGIEDFDFWLRLIRENKKFINIPKKLVLHRLHTNSNFNTKEQEIGKIL